ncbi:MAG: hypothetical protein Kow0067_05950 [Coriobacteriia bacterium]
MTSCVLVIALVGALALPGLALAKDKGGGVSTEDVMFVPADSWESDDTTATARVLPAVSKHTLHVIGDEDWMKFSITQDDTPVVFETQITGGNDSFDLYMYLYELNADGTTTLVTSTDDHDYWDAYSQQITEYLDAGDYLLRVEGYGGDETGMYDLYWNKGYARRIFGANRYDTAVEVSRLMYQQASVDVDWGFDLGGFVIASGTDPADGIAGSLLASMIDSPLLLAGPGGLSAKTQAEITRALMPEVYYDGDSLTIYILGGTNAVPSLVEAQLKALPIIKTAMQAEQLKIVRISGTDRYDTAAKIAKEYDDYAGVSSTAYVVNGEAWADALAVAAPSVFNGSAILEVTGTGIPAATLKAFDDLGITDVVVIGGEAVVSPAVYAGLEARFGVANVDRIAGADRYATAYKVAVHAVDVVGLDSDRFVLAGGENFADAMLAGPMTFGYEGEYGTYGPILLTPAASLAPQVKTFMDDYGAPEYICYVLGGPAAVSGTAMGQLNAYRVIAAP